ncbi:hypothetical protein [Hydrogenibacillus schlegelii]|uniref:TubC N-terminal docking domain-related protein n=1 Tax=Hydrogenibacillus schlegelii TaxID=1484 RepID=UPI00235250B2|nr:hypothetical protein [Hydrogenibacillus schlegelii]
MTAAELLRELHRRGVRITAHEGRLRCEAPRGTITPDLVEAMRQHKAELMRLLARFRILVDGRVAAVAHTKEKALEALDAVVRSTPLQPGRRTRIELRDGKGKALRTCYLPTRETLTTLRGHAGSDEGRAAAKPRGSVEVVERR